MGLRRFREGEQADDRNPGQIREVSEKAATVRKSDRLHGEKQGDGRSAGSVFALPQLAVERIAGDAQQRRSFCAIPLAQGERMPDGELFHSLHRKRLLACNRLD